MKLSVCLIVRDEEATIARCLDCVKKFADEIVVTDTGSRDKTVEIVRRYTQNIHYFEWRDDFSAARNFCLDRATGDYVMWLDADDVVPDVDCEKINALKPSLPDCDMVFLTYAAYTPDGGTYCYVRERIFRNTPENRFGGAVHEAVTPRGKIIYSDAKIIHAKVRTGDDMRNLRIYQKQISRGEKLDARAQFYYGRELMFHKMYRESEAVLCAYLDGEGWVENKIEACLDLADVRRALGDGKGALEAVFKSFYYAPPRPRACCAAGDLLFADGKYKTAEYWYKAALSAECDERAGGFVNRDFSRFIPYMRLCATRDRLGDIKAAFEYNEMAAAIKPSDEGVKYNRDYFRKLGEVKND